MKRKSTRSLTVLLPGLFGPALPRGRESLFEGLSLLELERFLARARRVDGCAQEMERGLFDLFGARIDREGDAPVAAVTRQLDAGDAGAQWWLRADPVHVHADRDRLVMLGNRLLDISESETNQLVIELNALVRDEGWELEAMNPRRWYLRLGGEPRMRSTALPEVIGRDVLHCMPRGAEARPWRRLLNEVQMMLHASSVNRAREQRGAPAVNSLWFWGGGVLPEVPHGTWSQVWSNEALATGLAALAGTPHASLPADAAEWLEDDTPGAHLLVLDGAREAAQYADVEAWRKFIESVHESWIAPLYAALKQGRLDSVTLDTLQGRAFVLDTRAARRWWLRRRPLPAWARDD